MIPTLPLLPELPGEEDEYRYLPAGRSIISVLTDEHEQITELSRRLAEGVEPQVGLATVVSAAITRHLSAEEQYLYPAVKALLPDGASIEEREIERDVQILKRLSRLEALSPETSEFKELATAVNAELHLHHKACATHIFPLLDAAAEQADLIRLGNRIEVAKEAAPTRPHPDSPTRPPWNKVTEPAIGIVDKIRDVMTGRKTYPEDL